MRRKRVPPHSIRLHGDVLMKYTYNFTLLPATECTLVTSHDDAFSLLCILFLANDYNWQRLLIRKVTFRFKRYDKTIEENPVHGIVSKIPGYYWEVKERKMQSSLQPALEPDTLKQTPSLASCSFTRRPNVMGISYRHRYVISPYLGYDPICVNICIR
jgi:hypothetical protein